MLTDFVKGFYYLLEGFRLIREPSLRRFIWIPLLCNFFLFLLMLIFAGYGLRYFSEWVETFLPTWLQWLEWLIWGLSILFSSIILIFVSTILVNVIAGPFNGLLSEKVLEHLKQSDKVLRVSWLTAASTAFWRQVQFVGYYLPRAVACLLIFLIPIIQIGAAVLWFLFNGWVFAMQYLDYPMDLHGISIVQMKEWMRTRRGLCLGFGSGVVLFSMIPLVNLVIVPVCVVAATFLFTQEYTK